MQHSDRKEAIRAYRDRKATPGIYALRCDATGQAWVGRAPDLASIRTRLDFTLRQGSIPHRSLREACEVHGAAAFRFEPLEELEPDLDPDDRNRALKARLVHWAAALGAEPI